MFHSNINQIKFSYAACQKTTRSDRSDVKLDNSKKAQIEVKAQ